MDGIVTSAIQLSGSHHCWIKHGAFKTDPDLPPTMLKRQLDIKSPSWRTVLEHVNGWVYVYTLHSICMLVQTSVPTNWYFWTGKLPSNSKFKVFGPTITTGGTKFYMDFARAIIRANCAFNAKKNVQAHTFVFVQMIILTFEEKRLSDPFRAREVRPKKSKSCATVPTATYIEMGRGCANARPVDLWYHSQTQIHTIWQHRNQTFTVNGIRVTCKQYQTRS